MSKQRSKAVASAIARTWAAVASKAAKKAVIHVAEDRYMATRDAMDFVEECLDKAGARATDARFRIPE
jgi:hypothetical protein